MKYLLSIAYFIALAIPTAIVGLLTFASYGFCSFDGNPADCLKRIPLTVDVILLILINVLIPITILRENRKYQKILLIAYVILALIPIGWIVISN